MFWQGLKTLRRGALPCVQNEMLQTTTRLKLFQVRVDSDRKVDCKPAIVRILVTASRIVESMIRTVASLGDYCQLIGQQAS